MSSQLDQLNADLREVAAHLAVWPNDKYAIAKATMLTDMIEALMPPATSDQRNRSDIWNDAKASMDHHRPASEASLEKMFESCHGLEQSTYNPARGVKPIAKSCGACKLAGHHGSCQGCTIYEEMGKAMSQAMLYGSSALKVFADDDTGDASVKHVKDVTKDWTFGTINVRDAVCFTFGADPDMDERWLDAERAKVTNVSEKAWTTAETFNPPAEPDKLMFPTSAFNLTGFENIRYGTPRY